MNPHRIKYYPRHNPDPYPDPYPDWRYENDRREEEYWAQMNALRWLEEHGHPQPQPTETPENPNPYEENPYEEL